VLGGAAGVLLVGVVLVLVFAGVFSGSEEGDTSSGKKAFDVSYVAGDFNAALVLHPRRLLKAKALADIDQDKVFGALKVLDLELLDLRRIEQLVVLAGPGGEGSNPFLVAAVVRFAEPTDGMKLVKKFFAKGGQDLSYKGKSYYKGPAAERAPLMNAAHAPDDRTLLLAMEPTLKKMLDASDVKSPLVDALGRADLDNDLLGVFAMVEPVRQQLGAMAKPAKGDIPPPLAGAADLPDQVKTATLAINLSGDTLLKLDLEAVNDKSAAALHKLAENALNFAKAVLPEARKRLPPETDPVALALFEVAEETLKDPDGVTVKQEGPNTIVRVKLPKKLDRLAPKLKKLVDEALVPRPAGEPIRPPKTSLKDIRALATGWVKDNNAFGPEDRLVADVDKQLKGVGPNQGFLLRLGAGLVKSGRQTVLCGWGGELFVFPLDPAQEKKYPLDGNVRTFRAIAGNEAAPSGLLAKLSRLKIDQAGGLDPARDMTGTVTLKRLRKGKGRFTLRLVVAGGGISFLKSLGVVVPPDNPALAFKFLSLAQSKVPMNDPLVAVLDVVNEDDSKRPGAAVAVSNPVAVLLNVKAAAPPVQGNEVADLQKAGGRPIRDPNNQVVGFDFASTMATDDIFPLLKKLPNLDALYVGYTKVTRAGVAQLADLTRLKTLDLSGLPLVDADLAPLAKLTALERLNLGFTKITGAGLTHLAGLKQLKALDLGGVRLKDGDLAALGKLTNLERVSSFLADDVTDEGLPHLAGLTKLQELSLSYSKVTDAGLKHLQGLKQLRTLLLSGTKVTGTGLASLKGMAQLTHLHLDGTQIKDDGLAGLTGLTGLVHLTLNGTGVTDAGLPHLKGLTKLLYLSLARTAVTGTGLKDVPLGSSLYADGSKFDDAGLAALAGKTNLAHLALAGTQVTDAGVKHLAGLTRLASLDLSRTKVTGTGLTALKGKDNLYEIQLARAEVTDDGLKFVKDLSGKGILLGLDFCPVTDKGLAHFKGADHFRMISLSDTKVTDAGLPNLEGLTQAKDIYFYRTAVTKQAVDKLKKALPGCFIASSPPLPMK
jgi:Leucine-rich repeat (LRR) protein